MVWEGLILKRLDLKGSKITDNPFECSRRDGDKCKAEGVCTDEDYKGTCCLFCPRKWTCWGCCVKVLSYIRNLEDNPSSRWSEKKNEEIEEMEIKAECRIMGNPSVRKKKEK